MPSQKVLMMPTQSSEHPSRLRREENPPYPEYAVEILRSALDIQQDLGGVKHAIQTLESSSKRQAETLDAIGRDARSAKIATRILIAAMIVVAAAVGWVITMFVTLHPFK